MLITTIYKKVRRKTGIQFYTIDFREIVIMLITDGVSFKLSELGIYGKRGEPVFAFVMSAGNMRQ